MRLFNYYTTSVPSPPIVIIIIIIALFVTSCCYEWMNVQAFVVGVPRRSSRLVFSSSQLTKNDVAQGSSSIQRIDTTKLRSSQQQQQQQSNNYYPKPNVEDTDNYRYYNKLSTKFRTTLQVTESNERKKIAIIGGGLSGLACAKYLVDAGHEAIVYEARDVLGGKVSAWQDADGDWIETGLHIFFGAYPNMMNLFAELDIEDRLQWKYHTMVFAMQELPGEFTSFNFIPGIPAPFHFALAILMNQKMLSWVEKFQTAPALLPMMLFGQNFINEQDEYSVLEYMNRYNMPDRINQEIFVSMAKALDFIDPDKLSMTVILTAMNRFINERNGSQIAFLDGNQPDRLCQPLKDHIETHGGGKVYTNTPIQEIVTRSDGSVDHLLLRSGEKIIADEYISAVPVDIFKRLIPKSWQQIPYFRQLDELEGIPVINIQIWFDRKFVLAVDQLCFSRSPLLSVYADMSVACKEYYDPKSSMLELVFAPCSPKAGADRNWIAATNEEIIDATMGELIRLFPTEIAIDPTWPATVAYGSKKSSTVPITSGKAKVRKYAVVKTPRSVYSAIPGRNKYRPSQQSPIPNFTLAGDYTSQKYLGSMEGAILGGKLAAQVVASRAKNNIVDDDDTIVQKEKPIPQHIIDTASQYKVHEPYGIKGMGPIAFGGGEMIPSKITTTTTTTTTIIE